MGCIECGASRACDECDGYGDSTSGIECDDCGGSGVCPHCWGRANPTVEATPSELEDVS